MGTHRTGDFKAIGILNIVLGALFSLVFMIMILGAGFMTAAGNAIGGEHGAAAGARGGFLMLVGIAAFAVNLMLFVSGIGVLKVAPWGRTLSVACGGLGIMVYSALLIGRGLANPYPAMLAYCVILIGLFHTDSWKAAFGCPGKGRPDIESLPETAEASTDPAPEASESEETREAA